MEQIYKVKDPTIDLTKGLLIEVEDEFGFHLGLYELQTQISKHICLWDIDKEEYIYKHPNNIKKLTIIF